MVLQKSPLDNSNKHKRIKGDYAPISENPINETYVTPSNTILISIHAHRLGVSFGCRLTPPRVPNRSFHSSFHPACSSKPWRRGGPTIFTAPNPKGPEGMPMADHFVAGLSNGRSGHGCKRAQQKENQ